jgi:hypothetical protein
MPLRMLDHTIHLEADCSIEEAEALYEAARMIDQPIFDLAEARHLHTAIVQVIMASGGTVRGLPPDAVLHGCLADQIAL